jgi:transposase
LKRCAATSAAPTRLRIAPPDTCDHRLPVSRAIPISLRMTLREDTVLENFTGDLQMEERRRVACLALGIDPATVVWPSQGAEPSEPADSNPEHVELSDEDWCVLAPFLPPDAPQASSMGNREFLEAVLAAMRRGGVWVSRRTPAAEIEAVRRRFGRWSHLGVFQALANALPGLALSPECKRLLAFAGQRAAQLKSRALRGST